jgi:hypothetical protein
MKILVATMAISLAMYGMNLGSLGKTQMLNVSAVISKPSSLSLLRVLTFGRTSTLRPSEIRKEIQVPIFSFDWLDTDTEVQDSGKYISSEYYALGYDSLNKLVRVKFFSDVALNYEVEIYRDTLFTAMKLFSFDFDKTHDVSRGRYLPGYIINWASEHYFIFDAKIFSSSAPTTADVTSIMQLDGTLSVKHFAKFNKAYLLSISKILYEEKMQDGGISRMFSGEELYLYKENFILNDQMKFSEIQELFSDYPLRSIRKGILKDIKMQSAFLSAPFWITEGNPVYK